jgi:hypothetical protein
MTPPKMSKVLAAAKAVSSSLPGAAVAGAAPRARAASAVRAANRFQGRSCFPSRMLSSLGAHPLLPVSNSLQG